MMNKGHKMMPNLKKKKKKKKKTLVLPHVSLYKFLFYSDFFPAVDKETMAFWS